MVNTTLNLTKDEIRLFLDGLRTRLLVKTEDETQVKNALSKHPRSVGRHMELAFIDQIVMECLSEQVKEYLEKTQVSDGKLPCDLILAESSQARSKKLARGNPQWTHGHPFYKSLVSNPRNLYTRWNGKDPQNCICPMQTKTSVICAALMLSRPGARHHMLDIKSTIPCRR